MAQELGCSRSSVQRGIDTLVAVGGVEVQAGGRPNRSADPDKHPFAAHYYRVILDIPGNGELPSEDRDGVSDLEDTEVPTGGHPPVPSQEGRPVPTPWAPLTERPLGNDVTKAPGLFEQPSAEPGSAAALTGRAAKPAPPPSAQAERMARLARIFEPAVFQAYFAGAHFREGPPVTLVLASPARCSRVRERFGDKIRSAFNDDHIAFDYQRAPTRVPEDA